MIDGSTATIEFDDDVRAEAMASGTFERIANGQYEGAFVPTREGGYVNLALVVKMEGFGF